MKYKTARKKIESGDLLVWSGNAFFSKIIKLLTRSDYTHVGIAYKIGGRLFVVESIEGSGVRIYPVSRATPFYWIDTRAEFSNTVEKILLKHVGEEYSWFGCLKGWLGIAAKKDQRWQCAEFSNYILRLLHIIDGQNETPAKLVETLLSDGYMIKEVT